MSTIQEIGDALSFAIGAMRDDDRVVPQVEIDSALDDAYAFISEMMVIEREFPRLRNGIRRAADKMSAPPNGARSVYSSRGFIDTAA